jgi:hypothetical protein
MKLACLFLLGLMLTSSDAAKAQDRFFMTVEAGQGIILLPGIDPYTFSAQAHPSIGLGGNPQNFMLGASLAAVYDNPDWAFMWGGRLVLFLSNLRKKPISGGPKVTYGTLNFTGTLLMESSELRRAGGGFVIDIWEGALLISPRAGYDRKFEKLFLEVGLGMNF